MKICIVIQSDAFRTSAGMRIRYERFAECFGSDEVSLEALTTAELLAAKELAHDVYIFCKTFDTAALVLARRMKAAGKAVGQDVFDDYFSQGPDPRLQRYRDWMRDMAPVTDFAICTTRHIADVLRAYMPKIPITPIDDPVIGFDPQQVGLLADAKVDRARETRSLEMVWFGIGDNPFFRVGLADLANCEAEIAALRRLGWAVNLKIVTNRRAFEDGSAEALRALGIGFEVVEWTEEAEVEALASATVALLPVNGQPFSRAKSLNRAITAFNGGCQILSVGYPLYERLDRFLYRSAAELVADIERGECRVGSGTMKALAAKIATVADPFEAAASFVREARRASKAAAGDKDAQPTLCVIHGRNSTIAVHKAVAGMRGLSVGTVLNTSPWNFPVRFDLVGSEVAMRVTPAVAQRFGVPLANAESKLAIGDFEFVDVDLQAIGMAKLTLHFRPSSPIEDAIVSESLFAFAARCCAAAFGDVDILYSDSSPYSVRPRSRLPAALPGLSAGSEPQVAPPVPAKESRHSSLVDRLRQHLPGRSAATDEVVVVRGSPYFDSAWYLETYSDVAQSGLDPAAHYARSGWTEERDPGPSFSTKLYLKDHPDVAETGLNPLVHYERFGRAEERRVRPRIGSETVSG